MIEDVKKMASHFNECGLKLNFSKTNFMIFRNNYLVSIPEEIKIVNDISIARVTSQTFLGIKLDEKFKFKEQYEGLIDKLTQSCRALSIIRHHLPQEMRIQFFNAHVMSHLHYCSFIYLKLNQAEILRLQRIQNRCIRMIFNLDPQHSTIDLFRTYAVNSLPVIGIFYYSMIINIKKSLLLDMDELVKYEMQHNNRRSSGELKPIRFKRRQHLGTDISYLGVILYNQLDTELKNIGNLTKFKKDLKKYLLGKIDLLLDANQLQSRKIS